jgi:mannose-6-phosphate isomerase-like protein (cupin superfamily)
MHVTRFDTARLYDAPMHEGVASFRLQGGDESDCGFCLVGMSHYLPQGRAIMGAGDAAKIYVVVEGELTVEVDGVISKLAKYDSCLIDAGEAREARNETNHVVSMIVINERR